MLRSNLCRLASKLRFQSGDLGLQGDRVIGLLLERGVSCSIVRWPLATREADRGGSGLSFSSFRAGLASAAITSVLAGNVESYI